MRTLRRRAHITLPADHPYASLMRTASTLLVPPPAAPLAEAPRVVPPEDGPR